MKNEEVSMKTACAVSKLVDGFNVWSCTALFIFTSALSVTYAQPVGTFLDDTIEVGRPFRYALSVRHPASQDVLFPDTTWQFAPFRVRDLAVFPTRTKNGVSVDSAVYTLVSFEVSRARVLQVPVYIMRGTDCTAVLSSPDTVFLASPVLTSAQPDTLRLTPDPTLAPLPQQFNYAYLVLVLTAVGVVVAAIYILLGKAIRQRWQLYVLSRKHLRFLNTYNQLTRNLGPESASDTTNQAIVTWKQYLEITERQPYTSLTSREITDRIGDDRLADALRETDRMIYGGAFTDQSPLALRVLRDVAVSAYQRRRRHILIQ